MLSNEYQLHILENSIKEAYDLKATIEHHLVVESRPLEIARFKLELQELEAKIKRLEAERLTLLRGKPVASRNNKRRIFLIIVTLSVTVLLVTIAGAAFLSSKQGVDNTEDLPAPSTATKISLSNQELQSIPRITDFSKSKINMYLSKDNPSTLESYYKTEMTKRGWNYDSNISPKVDLAFTKDKQVTTVILWYVRNDVVWWSRSQGEVGFMKSSFPSLSERVRNGDSIIMLVQGPLDQHFLSINYESFIN